MACPLCPKTARSNRKDMRSENQKFCLATEGTEGFSQLCVLGRPCSKSKLLPQGPAVAHGCILKYATIV